MRRPLIINGFMATGKTTIGAMIARNTGHPFIDLDLEIERVAGASVARLFATEGEANFRAREKAALAHVLEQAAGQARPPVVAVGGGALLAREVRLRALDEAVVITLEAAPDEIAKRASNQTDRPLLAAGDPRSRIQDLLELRALAYAESHARLSSEAAPEAVATSACTIWERDSLAVAAGFASYSVEIDRGIAQGRIAELVGKSPVCLVISDRTVAGLHGAGIEDALRHASCKLLRVDLEPGEQHKHIGSVEGIWHAALAGSADRKATFVGFGGGVVTDITGFAAATWMRGVRWVGIPTTMLAMIDASVGGKTGVDLAAAKNAVGAFWQPSAVVCDVAYLATEADRGFISGLAEAVKTALIGDSQLFELLEANAPSAVARDPDLIVQIVRRCIRVKARIVSADERESGARALLNLGHTVGHALEAQAGFTHLTHGEAVSLGLVAALRIGEQLGLTPAALSERTIALLSRLGLPTSLTEQPLALAANLIGHDKKRNGASLRFVVARALGQTETVDLELELLREYTRQLAV
jgi:shikimate kinase/3-dehydroquinate synthase